MREQISANIRAERNRVNLSQEEVAKKLGITRENYCRYETAKVEPKASTLYKLSLILGCSMNDFFVKINYTECEC